MRRLAKVKLFATEAEMCARFIAALPEGWTAYAETQGWDILIVRNSDGFQIGVQAKLRLNAEVFSQALEGGGIWHVERPGPDCRAVMVPYGEPGAFGKIADYCGITIISVRSPQKYHRAYDPELPTLWSSNNWHDLSPAKRHELPDYIPDVAAGAPAPLQLTPWKIGALRIVATIELRGFVTRADFKHLDIDRRRWVAARWITNNDGRDGDRYVAGKIPNFKEQHPRVYAEVLADAEKWMLPIAQPASKTEALFA